MRNHASVKLSDSRTLVVRELRLRDVRRLVQELRQDPDQLDILKLLGERFDTLAELASGCIEMPDGESVEDLALSEMEQVAAAFREVNSAFLDRMESLGLGLALQAPPAATSATSTAVPSASSSADIRASGTTAGDSSVAAST